MTKIYLDEYGDPWECDKFDECFSCKHKNNYKLCLTCDFGEEYEDEDMQGIDELFEY